MWYLIIPKKYLDRMNFLRLSYEIIVSTITINVKICMILVINQMRKGLLLLELTNINMTCLIRLEDYLESLNIKDIRQLLTTNNILAPRHI